MAVAVLKVFTNSGIDMPQKKCARCNSIFDCSVNNITACQCAGMQLSAAQLVFIKQQYSDCICVNCLAVLKSNYTLRHTKNNQP
jgi:hypothetical protein